MKFHLEPNQLTIRLEGLERLWALKGRVQVPHYAIESVDYLTSVPSMQDYGGALRLPGTAIPWRFYAGTYLRHGAKEFWYVKMRQPGVLVLAIKPDALNVTKIRVTCEPEIAQGVADWWQERR